MAYKKLINGHFKEISKEEYDKAVERCSLKDNIGRRPSEVAEEFKEKQKIEAAITIERPKIRRTK